MPIVCFDPAYELHLHWPLAGEVQSQHWGTGDRGISGAHWPAPGSLREAVSEKKKIIKKDT
ncbi:per-hexamer repeat gene 1 [Mus musculus]|nr:per-hexamer repeat gene 1 [Mus musculus]